MVARITESEITNQDFYSNYLLKNNPCIITEDATKNWLSRQNWITQEKKPNFNYLKTHFGTSKAPVANCKIKHYDAQLTDKLTLIEYIDYWEKYMENEYPNSIDCLYLKDWHFPKEFPHYSAYTVPKFFKFDWLNEYCKEKTDDDYDFVYMGPKGSWTPFHADVFRSHSWSANICGLKKWLLCPPGKENQLLDELGNLPYDLDDVGKGIEGLIEVIQGPGEIIFVPSNWYHQVYNLEDTISINRNWFNGSNVDDVFNFLVKSLEEVKFEINDCKGMDDWDKQCQIVLKASQGMDLYEFYELLKFIGRSKLNYSKNNSDELNSIEMCKLIEVLRRFQDLTDLPIDLLTSITTLISDLSI